MDSERATNKRLQPQRLGSSFMASSQGIDNTVLIVGAGPAGLVLALTLAQNDVPVRIITKEVRPHKNQRGNGIQPRTLEIYQSLGIVEEIKGQSVKPHKMRTYDTDPALPIGERGVKPLRTWVFSEQNEPTPARPYGGPIRLSQHRSESVLRGALNKLGIQVEFGTELLDFKQDEHGVEARVLMHPLNGQENAAKEGLIKAGWLIGTDGGRGVVRKRLGFDFLGQPKADLRMVVGDVRLGGGPIGREYWHMWENDGWMLMLASTTSAPEDDDLWIIFLRGNEPKRAHEVSTREALGAYITEVTGRTDIVVKSVDWLVDYHPDVRVVNKFHEGRVFLAGDAAHVHSATGGQGLNSSVQDSFNLAWKLALVIKHGASPDSLFSSYDEERLPVIAQMLSMTSQLLKHTVDWGTQATPDKNNRVDDDANGNEKPIVERAWHRGGALHMLGVNYRWSPIVVDGRPAYDNARLTQEEKAKLLNSAYEGSAPGEVLRAGDRAPDAPGLVRMGGDEEEKTSLFKVFSPKWHTALIFGQSERCATNVHEAIGEFPEGTIRTIVISSRGKEEQGTSSIDTLVDTDGHAYSEYGVSPEWEEGASVGWTIFVVRPDGYVGAVSNSVDGVDRYRRVLFGQGAQ